ncbi:hypothetical protein JWJ88_07445 [Paracoccus methylovorus]|uniref:Uncharacterized protein n=1 Tax=Paracoccus methylovorus TaxID=2812658 RepID=A0ABX7JFR4_9RHOB|nr:MULTISPECIES: hypothetical protein [Paracoccus]QRZ12451.1 hypothetical protein JWJ88_07445 [Paracoccus methylovorus]
MSKPAWDASELARSALSELTEVERVELFNSMLQQVRSIELIAGLRNTLTGHLNDLIADRYADHLLGEGAA